MSAQKLPVRFPLVTRDYISEVAGLLGVTSSEVARAAILLGLGSLKAMKSREKERGITALKVQSIGSIGDKKA